MKETGLWTLIRQNIRGHCQRVENAVGLGTPDVNCCYETFEVWIELKIVKGKQLYFEWTQIAWIKQRTHDKIMGRVLVMARDKDDIIAFNAKNLPTEKLRVKGKKAVISIEDIKHLRWSKPYNWKEIEDYIY